MSRPATSKAAGKRTASTERPTLVVSARQSLGSRQARRLRREGAVPGVVYGKAVEPMAVAVNHRGLVKFLHAQAGEHGLLTLRGEANGKPWERPVLIKRVEHDPVGGGIVHIDFHAITLTEQIRIKIPIVLQGVPIGVKQEGGVLEHFLREIEVECLPTNIPKSVEHDIAALKIGDAVHVRDLAVPSGARITAELEGVVASVLMPKEEKAAEAAEAVTEPEVIREKKPEAEEAAEGKEGKEKKEEKGQEKKA